MLDLLSPALLLPLVPGVGFADEITDPNQDRAGWAEFLIWFGLGAAMLFLAFSFVKQLRKAQAAKEAGVYGDEPLAEGESQDSAADETAAPGAAQASSTAVDPASEREADEG